MQTFVGDCEKDIIRLCLPTTRSNMLSGLNLFLLALYQLQ